MFLTWRRSPWFVQMPLENTPGDPGPGGDPGDGGDPTAHPDYDPDVGDPAGGGDDDPSRQQPGAPAGRAPVQPPRPGAAPGTPGAPGAAPGPDPGTPQTYTAEQYTQAVNLARTQAAQNRALQGQIATLTNQVRALTGLAPVQPPGGGEDPNLSEADRKAVAAIYRLFPWMKELAPKVKDLLQLPDTVNGFKSETDARWTDIGTRMWDSFDAEVKKAYGGRELHPFAQKSLDAAFVAWLETDKNAAARYRTGDTSLAAEFMQMYRNGVIVPAQAGTPNNPQRPGLGRPGQQPPRVPRGGSGGNHAPGQQPPQPNVKKPEEVHAAAADAYFSARG